MPAKPVANVKTGEFRVPYPALWLALAALLLYCRTFSFDLTELDDSIFIRDFHEFNENIRNIFTSFHRGLFDAGKDPYYRPLFLVSMILNYLGSDHGKMLATYHIINVAFHIVSVVLLFKLCIKLNVKQVHAFILVLLFSVLPVLAQDVAWIPGRNDTMLAIFTFSFFIYSINYTNSGNTKDLFLSALFLLLAFFTKETAVFAIPVAIVMLVFVLQKKWLDKSNLTLYVFWAGCFLIWFTARSLSTTQSGVRPDQLLSEAVHRLPIIVQYLGKIFLPFNLSVFPIQKDITIWYGIATIVLLAVAVLLAKEKNYKIIFSGLAIFILFLLPALLVPSNLNKQVFEHRLYLPVIGILLILPQTILLRNKLTDIQLLYGGIAVSAIFAIINFIHQENFQDRLAFWTNAVETSPHSGYAKMMLAARLDDTKESYALFREAYRLDPNEKYINYYYGVMLQKEDSVMASEKYLLTERNTSGYFESHFYLARVDMEKKDFSGAISQLDSFLVFTPDNEMANNNLLLLYLQTQQTAKAKEQVKHMRQFGLKVPPQILQQLGM